MPPKTPASRQNAGTAESSKQLNFLFVGDIMLDRGVRQIIRRHGVNYLFENLKETDFFQKRDFVVANLEGAVTANGEHLAPVLANDFAFAPADVLALKKYNFNFFTLANNHVSDQGLAGEQSTRTFLTENKFNFVGCRDRQIGDCTSVITQRASTSIAWLGFSQIYGRLDQPQVIDKIKEAKQQADFVVVNIHWGSEYQAQFSAGQQSLARAMVEAGADLIIGHHPHVIQGAEQYKHGLIFYSLGNFIFDQYFSAQTQRGLGIGVALTDGRIEADIYPLVSSKSRPKLLAETQKQALLAEMASLSSADPSFRRQVRAGKIIIER